MMNYIEKASERARDRAIIITRLSIWHSIRVAANDKHFPQILYAEKDRHCAYHLLVSKRLFVGHEDACPLSKLEDSRARWRDGGGSSS